MPIVFRFSICLMLVFAFGFNGHQGFAQQEDILFSAEGATDLDQLRFLEKHFADLAVKVKPATVNIQMGASQGSGVVVSSDGYILTAAHVIGRPNSEATITFPDGTRVKAETLGISSSVDSGMLKIKEGEGENFPYLDIGLSSDLKQGQWVMAVGHPGGIDKARGLVVRVGRIITKQSRVLKSDCTLVGGDSGGPLLDMNGAVIGIHSRIGRELTDNLHVPVDQYSENWDRMAKGVILDGRAGSLGINVVDKTNEVKGVTEKGPAEKAGLQKGDIIIKMGGKKIEDREDIGAAVKSLDLRPNDILNIVVLRDGEEEKFQLKVANSGPVRRGRR
ncbi:MAG: S1C family serine protease [Mariniblastus sp.]